MSKTSFFTILIFAFCFSAFAQTNETSPCPTISVTGPPGIPKPNEPFIFTASISQDADKFNPMYVWKVYDGEIIEGQGTLILKVLQKDLGESLTVSIEVIGLPKGCANIASETAAPLDLPSVVMIDSFSTPTAKINKARLDNFTLELRKNSNAQGYIIEKFERTTPQNLIDQKLNKTLNYLDKENGISKDRITILTGISNGNLTQFFIVPAGAEPPAIEENN